MKNIRNILLYAVIAAIIIIVVVAVEIRTFSPNYTLAVSLKVYGSNATIYPFESSFVQIIINNTGTKPLVDFPLTLYINGRSENNYQITLGAHRSTFINSTYTYPANGTYSFEVVGDPGMLLPITDRSKVTSLVFANVSPAQYPDIYTSIPNNNITYTQSFSLYESGAAYLPLINSYYNISLIRGIFGQNMAVGSKFFEDYLKYIYQANGAYVRYSNNESAYVLWVQGTVPPSSVESFLSSFGFRSANFSDQDREVVFSNAGKNSSICTFYDRGWTKIVEYYNGSLKGNCASEIGFENSSNESKILVGLIKRSGNTTNYLSNLSYLNSTLLGYSIISQSNSISSLDFESTQNGWFVMDSVSNNTETRKNITCYGLLYVENGINICSEYIFPRSGNIYQSNGTSAINSTEFARNYTIQIYTVLNQSEINLAAAYAVREMSAIPISSNTLSWRSPFVSSCSFENVSIGCKVLGNNVTNNSVDMQIVNNGTVPFRINSVLCGFLGKTASTQINQSLAVGDSTDFSVSCPPGEVSLTSLINTYALELNYTTQNVISYVHGSLNLTNVV